MKNYNFLYALLMLLFAAVTAYLITDYVRYDTEREEQSLELGRDAGSAYCRQNWTLCCSRCASVPMSMFAKLMPSTASRQLLASIRQESHRFDLVSGVTVAFARDAFPGKELYAPYFSKALDEFQYIEDSYDYTDDEIDTARWFADDSRRW